jgi:holliday junction DNA helicase RuvA
MIGYLSGKVLDHSESKLLVAVGTGEGGTVGYSVTVPESEGHLSLTAGASVELFIYTHVREDALDLYGFRTAAEKDLFLTLLSVSGIGPKGALNILSGAEAAQLIQAIVRGDKAYLSRIPGIGKKTAERLVLEIGDKVSKKLDAGAYAVLKPVRPAGASVHDIGARSAATSKSGLIRDAVSALVGLGYREQEASVLLNRLVDEAAEPPKKVEDLIRSALRELA